MKTYIEALRDAIEKEMIKDRNIIVLGQDVIKFGGAGGLFKNFYKKFGNRIINTPISESATVGIATGAAMAGLKPIIEFSFSDFLLCAADTIINHAAKIRSLSNKKFNLTLVMRAAISSHMGYGATHSQNLEHVFMQPGLNVVYPSTPRDAAALMKAAFHNNNPTIFFDHKLLYTQKDNYTQKDKIHNEIEIGKAKILRSGKKFSLITYGRIVPITVELCKDYDVELLDLRTLQPLDEVAIVKAASKTGKVLIIEDGIGFLSSKIEAIIRARTSVDVERLFTANVVIPAAESLEKVVVVTEEKIKKAIEKMLV